LSGLRHETPDVASHYFSREVVWAGHNIERRLISGEIGRLKI
jgi:hypothetical protein